MATTHVAQQESPVVQTVERTLFSTLPFVGQIDLPGLVRRHLEVQGVVQGVGFRPFVHNLACQLSLSGWVRNASRGVELELEGRVADLDRFLSMLYEEAPPLARILEVRVTDVTPQGIGAFGVHILPSEIQDGRTLISPDVATCPACCSELFDPSDRRYRYPFTNCTYCGPRFTIIDNLPYDRPRTTMASFQLCEACAQEYGDPEDRRFHAQPVACSDCGPVVWYTEKEDCFGPGRETPTGDGAIAAAIRCLNRAGILALKGLGGFYLCCRAEDAEAVGRLRTSKFRPSKPLAVMVRTIAEAEIFCRVDRVEAALLEALEAPITLLRKRQDVNGLAPEIAPQNGYVGVMLPYTPLHHLLMAAAKGPLVMTSGNPSGEPLCTENVEARERLAGLVDGFLFHDRPIARRCDDSVMFVAGLPDRDVVQPVRRSRGLVPMPVWLPEGLELQKKLVVVGGDLKNVSAVAEGREVFLTPHIGDLGHPMVRPEQGRAIADLERLFQIQPEAVVCDLHPDYAGTRYARDRAGREEIPLIEVQHHHAHIAGCLAENGCLGPAIGLGFDGTGYGCDGHIWGGEVLLADLENFDRIFHLEYLPLPGGDAAIRQPHRIAIAYLHELMPGLDMADLFPNVSAREIDVIKTMLERHVNTPLTSSAGRLFDSVSALLGLCYEVTHEAQAAIALEAEALRSTVEGPLYTFSLEEGQIRLGKLFNGLVGDLSNGVSVRDIARRFHLTLAEMAVEAARAVRAEQNCLNTVALSGGVWQNRLLLEMAVAALEQKGFDVLLHHSVPANDGGLAYGQAAVAAAVLKAK